MATSNLYTSSRGGRSTCLRGRLWLLVREQVAPTPAATQDQRRLQTTLAARRSQVAGILRLVGRSMGSDCATSSSAIAFTSPRWPRSPRDSWTDRRSRMRHRPRQRGDRAVCRARDSRWTHPRRCCRRRRKRLQPFDNVDLRRGDLEALPIDEAQLDAATLMLVLHHVTEPARALAEVARVLKPGGRLILVDMLPHDREHYRQQMGHVGWDSRKEQIHRMLATPASRPCAWCSSRPTRKSKDLVCS
jgi:ArsR family transcriptional regulator